MYLFYCYVPTFAYTKLLNKNEVILREQNPPLKRCKPLELLTYFEIEFRTFNKGNMGSLGQRAAKLPSVKL